MTNKDGKNAVLFTTRTYSNTTRKHVYKTRDAASHLNLIFCHNPGGSHEQNMDAYISEIKIHLSGLERAKKPEKYIEPATYVRDRAIKYAEFFGLTLPSTINELIDSANTGKYREYLIAESERIEKEKKEKELKEIAEAKKLLSKWRKGKIHRAHGRINDRDFLRVYDGNIQTSQGIRMPIPIAKRIYDNIMVKISKGGCTECNMKILDYQVTEITPKLLTVGCHKIDIKEINSIAKKLNWIN